MISFCGRIALLFIFCLSATGNYAQNNFFTDAPESSFTNAAQKRVIIPTRYRTLLLNKQSATDFLNIMPQEKNVLLRNTTPVITIPLPDGTSARFHIWESAVMEPALAAKYPGIKTFTGQGIDDPTANIKLDITPMGFHAMIVSPATGVVFIDPFAQGNSLHYISYNKKDFKKTGVFAELPPIKNNRLANRVAGTDNELAGTCVGTQLRTYRLALAATGEYTVKQGGTVAAAHAAMVTSINRVNGVYERELSIRMVLVANNDLLIYTNGTTDPYTNTDGEEMLDENQANVTTVIGNANYDIGHVFSTGGGGVAVLGCVCSSTDKAKGVTGSSNPVGDPFDIDYVAHEMGHQFNANHTFNSVLGSCNGNGESITNAEPGSGSTIMAYAGICLGDNLQANSDPFFHAVSFSEIANFSVNGAGNGCAAKTNTGNIPPVVNAGTDYIIPRSTPFSLVGSATDANGDVLTYSWEQVNVGGPPGTYNNPVGDAPLFRSFIPQSVPTRFFPALTDVINNTTTKGELLPAYGRTLNFRLTARDNRAGGGGVCNDENMVTVNNTAGPFLVTYPNTTGISLQVNDFAVITWDPSGTSFAPINCTNVKIELSTNGGLTFPITLSASTANDGVEEIIVPNNITTQARIRISAIGNIFYDMSNANFSIQNSGTIEFVLNNPLPVIVCGSATGVATLNTSALNGFATNIGLSASGVPAGTTVSFGSTTVAPGSGTTVTLNNINTLANGTYNITVTGIAGAVTKTRVISFVVNNIPAAPSTLTSPAANATGVTVLPSFNWSATAGASSYTLQISTSSTFSSILQSIPNITALPVALPTALSENTVYYWRVNASNNCGDGLPSAPGIFRTGLTVCNINFSTDVPKSISSSNTPTITSTIVIPASAGGTITDLNVIGLKGLHSYVNDLTVTLTSPAGTDVVLFDQVCDTEANFDINFDDESSIAAIPCPPTGSKTVKPQNPLSAFDGQPIAGTWTLTIKDNFDQDGGSLTAWGLSFNCTLTAPGLPPWTQLCSPTGSTSLLSNLSGAAYQWQVNTGTGFTNITNNANYSGVNTAVLQITSAPVAWNGYQYRCVVDGNNSTAFTLGFTNYWTGAVSNAWETAANWSCNAVPDINTDVVINSGAVIVKSAAVCRSIRVNPGAIVTVNTSFKLTVAH